MFGIKNRASSLWFLGSRDTWHAAHGERCRLARLQLFREFSVASRGDKLDQHAAAAASRVFCLRVQTVQFVQRSQPVRSIALVRGETVLTIERLLGHPGTTLKYTNLRRHGGRWTPLRWSWGRVDPWREGRNLPNPGSPGFVPPPSNTRCGTWW